MQENFGSYQIVFEKNIGSFWLEPKAYFGSARLEPKKLTKYSGSARLELGFFWLVPPLVSNKRQYQIEYCQKLEYKTAAKVQ